MIVVIIGYSVYSKKHHVSSADAALQRKRKQKYWNNMYQIMSDSRIFKGHIEKLTKRLKQMSVYRLEEFRESGEGLTVGEFCFRVQVNGKMLDVNFDFPAYAANVLSDNTLMFEAGAATFFSNHNDHLDECYDEEYAKMGISRADLTGEVLSSATEIREVAIDCDYSIHLKILDITFIEDGKSYHVDKDVVEKFSLTGNDTEYYRWKIDQLEKLNLEHQRNNRLSEILAVERLCKSIGYGNVMDIASSLWAIEEGVPMHVPAVEAYLTEEGKKVVQTALNARIEEITELKHLLLF